MNELKDLTATELEEIEKFMEDNKGLMEDLALLESLDENL